MSRWLKKLLVAVIAVMTLGIYVPPLPLTEAEENKGSIAPSADKVTDAIAVTHTKEDLSTERPTTELLIDELTEQAKAQTMMKLGPRISKEIDDEMTSIILPYIEETISSIMESIDDKTIPYYKITEQPTDGYGEKIFNIYDVRTGEKIVLFHVRRDNRPLDGYYFNFHYHLQSDNFEKHYEIGDIYWNKNVPPKWMAN